MSGLERITLRRIGLAQTSPSGSGMLMPRTGTGGGGEFGANITNDLRAFAITREPIAHRIVFTVAHDIFDNWFELELEGEENAEASEEFDKKVQAELTRLRAKQELSRMAVFERGFQYGIIVLGYEQKGKYDLSQPAPTNAAALKEIKAYGTPQVSRVDTVEDPKDSRYGMPEYYNIKREGIAADLKVHHSRVIHFATRLVSSDWESQSALDPVWDDLTALRNIRWSMAQTMYRYGSGFPDITFKNAELADIQDWEEAGNFSDLSVRTYFAHTENQELEFKGTAGHELNPMNYYLPIMENISAGSGIPLAILRGVQAGALTGSEVNQREYYGLISDEQSAYEEGIRQLIDIIIKTNLKDLDDAEKAQEKTSEKHDAPKQRSYKFNWISGFELSEKEQAEVEMIKAQTLAIKKEWNTRNELRIMENPDAKPLPEGQGGDEVVGVFNPQQEGFGEGKFQQEDSFLVTKVKKKA